MPKIKLNSIKCHHPEESEDHPFQPGDELRLDVRIDGEKFFTLAVWKGTEFITNKKRWINREWDYLEKIEFRLVELDGAVEDIPNTLGMIRSHRFASSAGRCIARGQAAAQPGFGESPPAPHGRRAGAGGGDDLPAGWTAQGGWRSMWAASSYRRQDAPWPCGRA